MTNAQTMLEASRAFNQWLNQLQAEEKEKQRQISLAFAEQRRARQRIEANKGHSSTVQQAIKMLHLSCINMYVYGGWGMMLKKLCVQ